MLFDAFFYTVVSAGPGRDLVCAPPCGKRLYFITLYHITFRSKCKGHNAILHEFFCKKHPGNLEYFFISSQCPRRLSHLATYRAARLSHERKGHISHCRKAIYRGRFCESPYIVASSGLAARRSRGGTPKGTFIGSTYYQCNLLRTSAPTALLIRFGSSAKPRWNPVGEGKDAGLVRGFGRM